MSVTIWTIENCPECERVKSLYPDAEIIDLQPIMDGRVKDIEVISQLSMQNMAAPVIMVDGVFVLPQEAAK